MPVPGCENTQSAPMAALPFIKCARRRDFPLGSQVAIMRWWAEALIEDGCQGARVSGQGRARRVGGKDGGGQMAGRARGG